jgi:aspartate aminotransferase
VKTLCPNDFRGSPRPLPGTRRRGNRVDQHAARIRRIRESPSLAAAARVREMLAAGRDVLDLIVGEPDFDTPRHIKDAAIAAIEAGDTKYTTVNGTLELREAIVAHVQQRTGINSPTQITVSGGAKQVIYLALAATLDAGEEVIVPAPYWVSYPDMVLVNDGVPVIVPCPALDGFRLTPEALRTAIGPRTRWLMLNTPSNPSGAVYSPGQLRALADVLLDHTDVGILTDEIYDAIWFGDGELRSIVAGRTTAGRPYPDRERRVQGVRDDRLADRLRGRPTV